MRYVTRIHLSDCGWREAYYPGTTIDLTDPRTGKPTHTVFNMENTGGKTSFLSLVLSCFDTNERRFLKTLIRPNQKFSHYFWDVPAFILVEWDLSDDQPSLLETPRLVTGQVVVPLGAGQQKELERHFFTYRTTPDLSFDDIPAPGLRGFARGRINGRQDLQRWFHDMRANHPGNFQAFENQTTWKRKLAEEKIDTALLAAQVEFNRSEGGIEDFLNFRDEPQFVRKFLRTTMPDAEASEVRRVLADHVDKLADRPRLVRRREAMRQLRERFAPFVEAAEKVQGARSEVDRQAKHAAGLQAALRERRDQAERQTAYFVEQASRHEEAAKDAAGKVGEARVLHASAVVETARRSFDQADAIAQVREQELADARSHRHLLQAALLLTEIQDDQARTENLQRDIDAQDAELEPRRVELRAIGANLVATIEQRVADFRGQQRTRKAEADKLVADANAADKASFKADDDGRAAERELSRIERNIELVAEDRARLEESGILRANESAAAGAERHTQIAQSAIEQAQALSDKADSEEKTARDIVETRSERKAERSALESVIDRLRQTADAGQAKRQQLAFHQTILSLTAESEVDPDSESVVRIVREAKTKSTHTLRSAERRQEVLNADRESLEAVGLASIDKDARGVAERLRERGLRDAQPYASWLSSIVDSPADIRRFAEMDPARFGGVAVPDREALARARDALTIDLPLSRPVVVAVASEELAETPDDRFVLSVDQPAAYDREAARELLQKIEHELSELANAISKTQDRIDQLDALDRDLETWRERFGDGKLTDLWRDIEQKQERITEIDHELAELDGQLSDCEQTAQALRRQAKKCEASANEASEHARRAQEHHETWEARLDAWRIERREREQTLVDAKRRKKEEEARRDELRAQAAELNEQARTNGATAAALEREATEIEHSTSGGHAGENLDVLRRDYGQRLKTLQSLESNRVDHLRGRKEEIDEGLVKKRKRFERQFGDLDRNDVAKEAAKDNVAEAAEVAEAAIDRAQSAASGARADAISANREFQSEKEQRAKELRPTQLSDLTHLDAQELAEVQPRTLGIIEDEQAREAQETASARRAKEEATSNRQIAERCQHHVTTLAGLLSDPPPAAAPIRLPSEEEVANYVSRVVTDLARVEKEFTQLREYAYQQYDQVRKFTNSDAFRQLEGEREVATHLAANDPLAAAASARVTARLIDDRLKSIEHDLSRLDEDLETCVAELSRLLATAVHNLRRMTRDSHIPEHVPRFGGQPVFRMTADLKRVAPAQRKEMLINYVTDLAEAGRIPETGHDIAAELIDRMIAALGRNTLGIQLLKPKGEGDTEHMPIDQVTVSGGELLTAAMMIYLVLARLRAEARHGRNAEGGILIMDNPFGKANKALLLKTQIGLADAMGIQLFYTTGVQDTSALAEFENIIRLRRNKQSSSTRRIHVEAMRVLIDKQTGIERTLPATTAQAAE